MNIKQKALLLAASSVIFVGSGLQGCFAASGDKLNATVQIDTTRSIVSYFIPATTKKKTPDPKGFIQRWSLLEPISKPNRSNTVFTDSYLRTAFATEYFPNQFTVLPKDGDKVKVGEQELMWHALDSKNVSVSVIPYRNNQKFDFLRLFFPVVWKKFPIHLV